jgi:hypothetical protein
MEELNGENIKGKQDILIQANQIKSSIKILEKELVQIQSVCNHPEYEIKNCPSQSSTFQLRKVCKKCTKEIGYPNQEETDSWVSS